MRGSGYTQRERAELIVITSEKQWMQPRAALAEIKCLHLDCVHHSENEGEVDARIWRKTGTMGISTVALLFRKRRQAWDAYKR